MTKINILLVDDHPVVRNGLKYILERQPDFLIVGEAGTGQEALSQLKRQAIDVVIMDITMPDLNGIEATQYLHDTYPDLHIIILSLHSSNFLVFRALQAGATGYLLKGANNSEIITAIRAVYNNQRYLSQTILNQLTSKDIERLETLDVYDPVEILSAREREVLQLVVEGYSSADIAERLYLSQKTVETYRYRLMRKLNIGDLAGLVKFAIQHNITSLD